MRRSYLGLGLLAGTSMLAGALGALPATAAPPSGASVATGGGSLNLRTAPTSLSERRGGVANGTPLAITCRVDGQQVRGYVRRTDQWDLLSNGLYVTDAYVRRSTTPPVCPSPSASGS